MLKRSGTLIALAAGTTMLLMTHNVRAVETLPLRDSSDFNLQINGEVAPPAVIGNPTWTSDGDFITINMLQYPHRAPWGGRTFSILPQDTPWSCDFGLCRLR